MNDIVLKENNFLPDHAPIIKSINEFLPEMTRASKAFKKTQSQFMNKMMTLSHPTPYRNLRQIMSEMTRTKQALQHTEVNCEIKVTEIEILEYRISNEDLDERNKTLLSLEIKKKYTELEETKGYVSGALRKMEEHIDNYKRICAYYNIPEDWNEEDFEKQEEEYHVKTAFIQALAAARGNHGIIDNGNHIYFSQIGINGSEAQFEVTKLLREQGKLLHEGKSIPPEMDIEFYQSMFMKFKGCSERLAEYKGIRLLSDNAIIK